MRYHYLDTDRKPVGPLTREELRELYAAGTLQHDTPVRAETEGEWTPLARFWANRFTEEPPGTPGSTTEPPPLVAPANGRAPLKRHILVPWEEVSKMKWLDSRRLLGVAAVGLFPLFVIATFNQIGEFKAAYWAVAFYFSSLWAIFFYFVFPAPHVTVRRSLFCFFGTGIFSISILQLVYYAIAEYTDLLRWAEIPNQVPAQFLLTRWGASIFGIGLPEELCKSLVLFSLWRRHGPTPPQTMLFYGLMAGLGFGIYEGVYFQTGRNLMISGSVGEYYLLNVLRLTALPFIHAIWSGICGYFIGFASQYPSRKKGLILVAISLPTFLHGTYNAAGNPLGSLGVALISVLALNLYLAKSRDFEKVLTEK